MVSEATPLDWLTQAFAADSEVPLEVALVRLAAALALGCGVALVCRLGKGGGLSSQQRGLIATLVLLTVLLALTTIVIGSNVARAFSIVGALSIVRFRTVVSDTRDTAFVICAVAIGMAAGAGYFVLPLASLPVVAGAAWVFRPREAAALLAGATHRLSVHSTQEAQGTATVSVEAVHAMLARYHASGILAEVATTRATAGGPTSLERCFEVRLHDDSASQALVLELQQLPGISAVELRQA